MDIANDVRLDYPQENSDTTTGYRMPWVVSLILRIARFCVAHATRRRLTLLIYPALPKPRALGKSMRELNDLDP